MSALFALSGFLDRTDVLWHLGDLSEANDLLARHHYLGPLRSGARMTVVGSRNGEPVAAMMWKHPTSRRLPSDGSWLELSRWCLTSGAGDNAGSRMHKWSVRLIREHLPEVTTLVSYSDPGHGHTGALYRACNWQWAPTWVRLRPPPSGHGDWGTGPQDVKDRWVFCVRRDARREAVLAIEDRAAVRYWRARATDAELGWARRSLNLSVDVQDPDLVPRSEPAVDLDPSAGEAGHGALGAVEGDRPAEQLVEHERRIGLAPGEFHAAGAYLGGAS